MVQLKDLVITMMYLYIFVIALCSRNLSVILVLIIIAANYLISKEKFLNFDKKLRECLSIQREAFINILSHDLRIPVIAQIRALELLEHEKLGFLNNTQKNMLTDIEDSNKYILNLMSLMINTYSIENDKYKLIFEKFNISEVITACFDELLPQASEKNITFEYENSNKNLNITGDKEELKKVIMNILFSSISNANTGQKVLVKIRNKNNKIRLTVTGDKNNLLSFSKKINSSYSSIGQDIRMGFCRKIIESHKGKIVENSRNNTFSFEIPLAAL